MRKISLKILSFILAVLTVLITEHEGAGKMAAPYIKIDKSDSGSITFEIFPQDFKRREMKTENEIFQLLEIDGFSQNSKPGKPQLPFKGVLLGIPSQKEIRIEVLEKESVSYKGFNIYPSPKIIMDDGNEFGRIKRKYFKDKNTYSKNRFYPGEPVELGFSGMLRDQKVCQIKVFPIQYNPVTKEIRFYKKIKVRASFTNLNNYKRQEKNNETKAGGNEYESLIKNLVINYDALGRNSKIFNIDKRNNNTAEGLDGASPYRITKNNAGAASMSAYSTEQEDNKIKISVEEDGIYMVSFSDLKNAGMDLSGADSKYLRMFNKGKEVAIDINAGEDGYFNEGDYIIFYGEGNKGIYSKTNIYWLYMSAETGLRMIEKDGSPIDFQPTSTSYKAIAHFEEDNIFWRSLPGDEGKDYWFWKDLKEPAPSLTENFSFELNNIADSSGNANLRIVLQGKTDDPQNLDHHTKIYLNGTQVDDVSWNGQTEKIREIPVAQTLLINGLNGLDIEEIKDTGVTVDTIYLNWFEVEYLGNYIAENNIIKFTETIGGTYNFKIDGFSGSDIKIFDITDPVNGVKIINNSTEQNTSDFTTKFSLTYGTISEPVKKKIIALFLNKIQTPSLSSIVLDEPSSLKAPGNDADYIIITHEDFYNNVLPLAEYREKEGLRVKIIKVADIYDEFNYGIFDPGAIRDFLKYAYENWERPAPTYVLLAGGANEDYKDNLKKGSKNYIPTHLYKSEEMGFTYSDNWFVCVSGDDILPDMFIGRITKNGSDIDSIVKKIIKYGKDNLIEKWKRRTLFVADDDDPAFESISDELAADYLPSSFTLLKIYLSSYSDKSKAKDDVIKSLNNGCLITNYFGHGDKDQWAQEKMLVLEDIPLLTNKRKEPFVINFNCQTGLFAYSDGGYSLAEKFLSLKDNGAISMFAPSGLGYTYEHKILAEYLFSYLFSDNTKALGFCTTEAKIKAFADGVSPSIVETYILFGDPALKLLTNDKLSIITETLPEGKIKTPYSFSLKASGGSLPYRWEVKSKLPPGLKLSKKDGRIYGKPKRAGEYSLKIKLTDSGPGRSTVTKEYTINIAK